MSNLTVVSMYWPFLHAASMEMLKDGNAGVKLQLYLVHTLPALACCINTAITPCVLRREFWKSIVFFAFVYLVILFTLVKTTGVVLYWMFNFNDGITTYLWVVGLVAISLAVYLVLVEID